ncbi:MAG: DUF1015 domain-containing protein [Oscillospiraceae bacterium]
MTAFQSADILLPKNQPMEKWACIACDQFTSQPEYWKDVEKITDGAKSAYDLILPEAYLEDKNLEDRINRIHENMDSYINDGVFEEYKDALIYIERMQTDGKMRAGIVGKIDLEEYDYRKGSDSLVRATEQTVVERIPPRVKIRNGAALELPHIMILIDDTEKSIIEPLETQKSDMTKVYDFELMKQSGKISGYLLNSAQQKAVFSGLEKLGDLDSFNSKYGLNEKSPLVYAMGDGNHSLATAKEYYEMLKRENPDKDLSNHPARYALVEIVNLHSPALEFEAIHRVITEIDKDDLMAEMTEKLALSGEKSEQKIVVTEKGRETEFYIHNPQSKLTVGSLQQFLDGYIKEKGGKIDYIHGTDVVKNLSQQENTLGFLLPDMGKEQLFPTVICDGALPRKTFSMGHAADKRFYIEARKIK